MPKTSQIRMLKIKLNARLRKKLWLKLLRKRLTKTRKRLTRNLMINPNRTVTLITKLMIKHRQ